MRDEWRQLKAQRVSRGSEGAENEVAVDFAARQAADGEHISARVVTEGDDQLICEADAQEH